jgi:malonyl-CoA/methylmalonyl-CoA synthetase
MGAFGSIAQAFVEQSDRAPERALIFFEGDELSYGQMRQLAEGWAQGLRACRVGPGDRVALFLENSPAFLGAYLGAHLAGAIVVLVNTQYRQTELSHILSDAGVRLCVTDAERLPELDRVRAALPELTEIIVAEEWQASDAAGATTRLPAPDDVALIAYTSGTTGRSKGAMLTHGNLLANSAAVTKAWRWTQADRLLLTLPLFHIHGLGVGIHGTLLTGASADLRRRFVAGEAYDELLKGEATMFFGVPTMYTRLIAEARSRASLPKPLRLFVSGSAPLSVQTFEEFEGLFGQRILERYGMTETVMNLTNPYHGERRPGTVGGPFPGQEARIVDVVSRSPVGPEATGEIQVRGPHVFKGYWGLAQATAEAFDAEGWFNTGDLGSVSADGYYTISGRARELIISGGYNVYPREVEEVLLRHPAAAEVAVLGMPHPDFGEQVVAVVVRGEGEQATGDEMALVEELVALCRDQLAAYKKPRQVFFAQTLPRNALGKVQKHLLREELERKARPPAG